MLKSAADAAASAFIVIMGLMLLVYVLVSVLFDINVVKECNDNMRVLTAGEYLYFVGFTFGMLLTGWHANNIKRS